MYEVTLYVHSWLRWVVLATGGYLWVVALSGWVRGADWSAGRERLRIAAVASMDLQLLLGLSLYFFLSPTSAAAMADLGAAMKSAPLRFFGVEHIVTMLLAVVVMHVGHVRARRDEARRYRRLFITQTVWLVLVLAAIPWPALDIGRPLFRL